VGRGFEILRRVDPVIIVQALREGFADAGDRREQTHRVALAAEPFEHRESARFHEVADRPGDGHPDRGQ
jgi:hypothetical protein